MFCGVLNFQNFSEVHNFVGALHFSKFKFDPEIDREWTIKGGVEHKLLMQILFDLHSAVFAARIW